MPPSSTREWQPRPQGVGCDRSTFHKPMRRVTSPRKMPPGLPVSTPFHGPNPSRVGSSKAFASQGRQPRRRASIRHRGLGVASGSRYDRQGAIEGARKTKTGHRAGPKVRRHQTDCSRTPILKRRNLLLDTRDLHRVEDLNKHRVAVEPEVCPGGDVKRGILRATHVAHVRRASRISTGDLASVGLEDW